MQRLTLSSSCTKWLYKIFLYPDTLAISSSDKLSKSSKGISFIKTKMDTPAKQALILWYLL